MSQIKLALQKSKHCYPVTCISAAQQEEKDTESSQIFNSDEANKLT
jgi:hypothetical protein